MLLNTTEQPSLSTSTPILPSTSLVVIQQHKAGLPTPKNCLISSEQDLAQATSTASRFQPQFVVVLYGIYIYTYIHM